MTLARNVALGLGVFAAQCAVAFGISEQVLGPKA